PCPGASGWPSGDIAQFRRDLDGRRRRPQRARLAFAYPAHLGILLCRCGAAAGLLDARRRALQPGVAADTAGFHAIGKAHPSLEQDGWGEQLQANFHFKEYCMKRSAFGFLLAALLVLTGFGAARAQDAPPARSEERRVGKADQVRA